MFCFYRVEHNSPDGRAISVILVELWYNYVAQKAGKFFLCDGMCNLKNNLGKPMYWYYLSFNKNLSVFLEKIRVYSKVNDNKAKIQLVGKYMSRSNCQQSSFAQGSVS